MTESRSLEDLLAADHMRIDGLLQSIGADLDRGDTQAAGVSFRAMGEGLGHHMEWEESALFPAVPPSPRMAAKHVESLLIDHERIRRSLKDLAQALEEKRVSAARSSLDELIIFLAGHNGDEEVGIYREADRVLESAEKLRLARSFRA